MRTSAPRVSVVMPVYNAAPYLAQAVESVLDQSFKNFEFLIHDDGSSDASWRILVSYAERDARISLSRSENRGIPATVNFLMGRVRGDLIARMDADDICPLDRFAIQVHRFDEDPCLSVLGGSALLVDEGDRPIMIHTPPLSHSDIDDLNMRGVVAIQQSAVMMRHSDFLRAGGYNDNFPVAEDHDLWLRMAEIGKLQNLPDVLIKYRIHNKSISGRKRDLQRDMCLQACQEAWARRGVSAPFEYSDWRMDDTRASRLKFYLRYAWQAWSSGYRSTWRHYALKAVRLAPASLDAWKCLIFGALRKPESSRKSDFG